MLTENNIAPDDPAFSKADQNFTPGGKVNTITVVSAVVLGLRWLRHTWERFVAFRVGTFAHRIVNLCALHRFFKLRQRYLMRRDNRFRLRYVLASYLCGFLALSLAVMEPVGFYVGNDDLPPAAAIETIAAAAPPETKNGGFAMTVSEAMHSQISEGMRRAMAVIQKAQHSSLQEVQISAGDTLAGALEDAGVSSAEAFLAVKAVSEHVNPKEIRAGQKIGVRFDPASVQSGQLQLASLNMALNDTTELSIEKQDETFVSNLVEKELIKKPVARSAKIQSSLYGSASRAGIPPRVIAELIRIYSYDIDFQRDIRQGDSIEVLYNSEQTEDGHVAKAGDLLYASLNLSGRNIPIYRYKSRNGDVDYFQPDGRSIRKTLMKTPIDGARLSSGFGMRRHPILGYNKMHKGMDFAAPTGTPIYAAGNGTVEMAGRQSGYGNYIRIRHNSSLKTAYAHLSRFAKGISKGKRVSQGDIIGYVGTTGRSTGPHLHYEVLVSNQQVNPNRVDLPIGVQLEKAEMKRFKAQTAGLHEQYVSLSGGVDVAFAQQNQDTGNLN